jgi:VanZ family protein
MNFTSYKTNAVYVLHWLWYWLPPLILMASIFYLSAQPDLPHAPEPWLDTLLKKLGHASEFAVLFLLFFRAWRQSRATRRALGTAWLSTAAYALSDEMHQAFVPGRHANWYDVVIDVSGALLLWWLLRGRCWRRLLHARDHDLTE